MSGLSRIMGSKGPSVDACDHEEESGHGGMGAEHDAGEHEATSNGSIDTSQWGIDANGDGDAGLLESLGAVGGFLLGGEQGSELVGGWADGAEAQAARERIDTFIASTHSVQNYAFQGWGNFDLSYAPTAGTVEVTVRIKFDFQDGTPGPDEDAAGYTWTDDEKAAWKTDFMDSVASTWSGQHQFACVTTDGELDASPTWQDLQPTVRVAILEDDANPQFNVTVARIPDGGFARSNVGRPTRDADGNVTAPGTAALDSEDMDATTKNTSPDGVTQRGAVHEFGHMIGMQDEYTSNPDNVGDATRQGTTKGMDDNDSIMSGGEVVQQAHYSSILEALNAAVAPSAVAFGFK
jgi:hypothetical protein